MQNNQFFVRGLKKWCRPLLKTKYHHGTKLYWKISQIYLLVTIQTPTKTSDLFSSIIVIIIRTFDFIACSDAVQVTCNKKQTNCVQLQEFPIVSHTFVRVRHIIKIFLGGQLKPDRMIQQSFLYRQFFRTKVHNAIRDPLTNGVLPFPWGACDTIV